MEYFPGQANHLAHYSGASNAALPTYLWVEGVSGSFLFGLR
jgi:hypothetical protein